MLATLPAGTPLDIPPQVARLKVTHYIGNYLEIAEIVVAVIYDLLQDRRTFTLTSNTRVRGAFDISEADILARWSDVEDTTLDLMTPDNAHVIMEQPFWSVLFDFIYASTHDLIATRLALRFIHAAMVAALADAKFPVLFQFQLNVLDQWFQVHDTPTGEAFTFDMLLKLLQAIAAMREIITKILDFSFEDLSFKQKIKIGQEIEYEVTLEVEGVVRITLPEDGEDLLTWSFAGHTFSLTLHFDKVTMADESEFALIADAALLGELRFPFGGSLNDLSFIGVSVSIAMLPELSPDHTEAVGPYHRYRDVYFVDREGESLGETTIRVASVNFDIEQTVLTTLLSAAGAYLQLFTSDDFGSIEDLLESVAEAGLESLKDFGGITKEITDALLKIVPGALACSTQDFHKPYLNSHLSLPYSHLVAATKDEALHILNRSPEDQEPEYTPNSVTHFPSDNLDDLWPGILDQLGPGPESGGGGRNSRLTNPAQFDQIRIPGQHRAEYERRLAARQGLPLEQEAAARLLIEGLDVRTIRFLHERQVERAVGTVAGKTVAPETLTSLDQLRQSRGAGAGSFLFAANGRILTAHQMFVTAAGSLLDQPQAVSFEPVRPSHYAEESPLDSRRGSAIDPSWIGLSVNSFVVDQAFSLLADSGAFSSAGEVEWEGNTFQYELVPSESLRMTADLQGRTDSRPLVDANKLEVTLSRLNAEVRFLVSTRVPMAAIRLTPGCLPDSALLTVVSNAGCIAEMTRGKFSDKVYRDELLYRHFIYLEPLSEAATLQEHTLLSGDPRTLFDKNAYKPIGIPLVLAIALRDAWKKVGRVPIVFDPYYALSPTIEAFDARDGWLNVYERYTLTALGM